MALRDAARHYYEPHLRVPLFPSKWQARLLTVYCLKRWDLRLLLRDYLVFRRLVANGASPDRLYATWNIQHRMPRYLLLHFAIAQLFAIHITGRDAWIGPFMTLICIPLYFVARAARGLIRGVLWTVVAFERRQSRLNVEGGSK